MNEMILVKMLTVVKELGTVTSANWYGRDYVSVDGVTDEGKKISMSLHISEEVTENGN